MNKIFLVTGPSGSGKTSLMNHVMRNEVVTITTRSPREGERDGIDYYFVSQEEFEGYIARGELIEYNRYKGNNHYYGVTKEKLEDKLSAGNCFAVIDFKGMKRYKELYPEAVTIFIYTNKQDLEKQLIIRGDKPSDIKQRLLAYDEEMTNSIHYDHVVKNKHGKFNEIAKIITEIVNS